MMLANRIVMVPMALAALAAVVALPACATGPTQTVAGADLPPERPADFTLGVVVYCDEDWTVLEECPARYIIEADGTMRVGVGDGSGPLTHPPIARLLEPPAFDELYRLTRDLSIYTAQPPEGVSRIDSPESYAPAEGKGYLIEIRARGEQRAWAVPRSDTSARALIRRLAELSWIKE